LTGALPFSLPSYAALPSASENSSATQTQLDEHHIARLHESILRAAGAPLDTNNIAPALQSAFLEQPQTPAPLLAAAINRLSLPQDALAPALRTAAASAGTDIDEIIVLLVADTYAEHGFEAGQAQLVQIGALFGEDMVIAALSRMDTASGDDDFSFDEPPEPLLSVYDG